MVNERLKKGMVPFNRAYQSGGDHLGDTDVSSYEDLFAKAKDAAFGVIGEPDRHQGPDPVEGVMHAAYQAVQDILPEVDDVDQNWLIAVLTDKPELFDMTVQYGTLAKGVVSALGDMMIDEMENELTERARAAGYEIPGSPSP